jgi:glycosyltransferase involved in cell wall biosynthesis
MVHLSVVIITFNEEKNIGKCLESVHEIADEIVVVDSFSTDQTEEICRKYSKVVFTQKAFDGFGAQKQFATGLAKHRWVLSLDADETLSEDLQQEIKKVLNETPTIASFSMKRQTYYQGRTLRFCGMHTERHIRLFDKTVAGFSSHRVHEHVVAPTVFSLKKPMIHFPYQNIAHHIDKINHYTNLYSSKRSISKLQIITKIPIRFLTIYFFKLAILDGFPGFIWAIMGSYYSFLKYTKIHEQSHLPHQDSLL